MTTLVSVLVPAYNAEQWIADTIKSALDQTWSRKEIIVVDDGSRDGTLAIARQFASENVRVVTQENRGRPRLETGPSNFAREITFNGSMQTISWHRTKSPSRWRQPKSPSASARYF